MPRAPASQARAADLERLRGAVRRPILFDLRNVLEPDRAAALGFLYIGTGRRVPAASPARAREFAAAGGAA